MEKEYFLFIVDNFALNTFQRYCIQMEVENEKGKFNVCPYLHMLV